MKRILTISSLVFAFASGAMAQNAPADDGPYIRIGGGVSFLSNLDQAMEANLSPPIFTCQAIGCNPDQRIIESDTGFLASGAIGFDYADGIRTELEYRYASNEISSVRTFVNGIPAGVTMAPTDMDVNAHFILSNFYFDFYNSSPITPFIGGGVGGAFVDVGLGERDGALAYQGRAGLSVAIGGGFSADLEYIYLRTNKLDYGPNPEDFTPSGPFGIARTGANYEASNVMLSLRKPF